jgi:hypothetical protein
MAYIKDRMGDTLVTVDDFDPLVSYSNYADWTTPDPSQNPTWFNASEEVTGSPWHQGSLASLIPELQLTFSYISSDQRRRHQSNFQFYW